MIEQYFISMTVVSSDRYRVVITTHQNLTLKKTKKMSRRFVGKRNGRNYEVT